MAFKKQTTQSQTMQDVDPQVDKAFLNETCTTDEDLLTLLDALLPPVIPTDCSFDDVSLLMPLPTEAVPEPMLVPQDVGSPSSIIYSTPPSSSNSLSNSPIPPVTVTPNNAEFSSNASTTNFKEKKSKVRSNKTEKQQKMFRKYKGSEKWKEEMFARMAALQTSQTNITNSTNHPIQHSNFQ